MKNAALHLSFTSVVCTSEVDRGNMLTVVETSAATKTIFP